MILQMITQIERRAELYLLEEIEPFLARLTREANAVVADELHRNSETAAGTVLGDFYIMTRSIRVAEERVQKIISKNWGHTQLEIKMEWMGQDAIHLGVSLKPEATDPYPGSNTLRH